MGRKGVDRVSKNIQKTRLILHGDLEEIDLSPLVTEINIPRIPGEIDTVTVDIVVDRFEVTDGTLIVHLRSE